MHIVGIDVGGTFTDVVLTNTDTGRSTTHKVPSTPRDPASAVLRGIQEICEREGIKSTSLQHVLHGTTVATNAVIQHKGVAAGLITTEGFRDIIHIGRHQRPQHYSIMQDIPWQAQALVPRRSRLTVPERLIPPHGEVLVPLDENAVLEAAKTLYDNGTKAIAICFLFSYINPTHEKRAQQLVAEKYPDLFVTTSHEVSAQFREFERFTTTAMNAYIGPLVSHYVSRIRNELAASGFTAELQIMRSNGGVASAETVRELPVYTLMSGLAAGVLGGAWIAELASRPNVITLDIGGTSADIGVITNGRFEQASARETFVGGYPIMVPMLDLHTLGAGGGSIAYIDDGGAFRVGPRSAGAEPGPAAYGRGGNEPTVTDANLVLGRIEPDSFLDGGMSLDLSAAESAIAKLAKDLQLSSEDAAAGVIAILNANMANAIRARTVQKGIDPREYSLLGGGGAGPLHAVEVARLLGIKEVILPPYPGINSAVGLLTTDLRYDAVQTTLVVSTELDCALLNDGYSQMEARLREQLARDGIEGAHAALAREASVRYVGQGYELRIEMPSGLLDDTIVSSSLLAFHDMHQNEYGRCFVASPIEIVNLHVTGTGRMPRITAPTLDKAAKKAMPFQIKPVLFRVDNTLSAHATAFYQREQLPIDKQLAGPAVITQSDSTTLIPPNCDFISDRLGNLLVSLN